MILLSTITKMVSVSDSLQNSYGILLTVCKDVTIFQRGSTCIMSTEKGWEVFMKG